LDENNKLNRFTRFIEFGTKELNTVITINKMIADSTIQQKQQIQRASMVTW
jgi:hypothetical protein